VLLGWEGGRGCVLVYMSTMINSPFEFNKYPADAKMYISKAVDCSIVQVVLYTSPSALAYLTQSVLLSRITRVVEQVVIAAPIV
jgi:hypothetical protein